MKKIATYLLDDETETVSITRRHHWTVELYDNPRLGRLACLIEDRRVLAVALVTRTGRKIFGQGAGYRRSHEGHFLRMSQAADFGGLAWLADNQ